MRLLALAAAAALPVAPSPSAPPNVQKQPGLQHSWVSSDPCSRSVTYADADNVEMKGAFKRLGELPPGDVYLSVYRDVNGCPAPVIVRYGSPQAPKPSGEGATVSDQLRPRLLQ